jgi:hypothetical protein
MNKNRRKSRIESTLKPRGSHAGIVRLISFLLALAVLCPVLYAPGALSQSYTTYTSIAYSTNVSTVTEYGTISKGMTTISSSSTTAVVLTTQDVPGYTDTGCYHFPYELHADLTDRLVGTIAADMPVNFYIMTPQQYESFLHHGCFSEFDFVFAEKQIRSYSIDWTPPDSGDYYLIFHNISFNSVTLKLTLSKVENLSHPIYSTANIVQVITLTQTHSAVQVRSLTQSWLTSDRLNAAIIALTLVLIAALVIGSRYRTSKIQKRKEHTRVYYASS